MLDSLHNALEQRSWRELRAIAQAHGLRFNTNLDKRSAHERLHRELVDKGQLRRSFRALTLEDRAALIALQAAGGTLVLHEFVAVFGEIRAYRPWREDAPVHPWRRPVSSAEKLWFLGFVHIHKSENGRPRTICAPADVLDLLPPLPRPHPHFKCLPYPALSPDVLRVDLAAFLGTLLVRPVKPRWHRWLPPWAIKTINARLRIREAVESVRSELQTGRLRFLHYLAEIGGLIGHQNNAILPTTAAWMWLELPPGDQWRWLWKAMERDIHSRDPVWNMYRFPVITPRLWGALITVLYDLLPDRTYSIRELVESLRPYVLEDETLESVSDLLRGPLSWAGIITLQDQRFMLTARGVATLHGDDRAFSPVEYMPIQPGEDVLWLDLPEVLPTRAWAEFAAWGTLDEGRWCVDAESVAQAVEQGHTSHDIMRTLGDLCGGMLPREHFAQIGAWAKQANRLVLRHMTVLTSPDADLLASLRQDRRLREMFGEPLSAFHSAIQPHAVEVLDQHLARRGYRVVTQIVPPAMPPSGDLAPETMEYLWLAARVYRDLSAFVDLPVHIPSAVLHDLATRLPQGRTDDLRRSADLIHDRLARTIEGYAALPPPIAQDDPAAIRAAVKRAHEQRGKITIEYFSPGYGAATIRTIAPMLPITESGGAEYIEAWCSTADAVRTFRLDRILRVIETGSIIPDQNPDRAKGLPP